MFTASVGNLLPGEETLIEISYVQRVQADEGALRVMIPTLVAPRYIPGGTPSFSGRAMVVYQDAQGRQGTVILGYRAGPHRPRGRMRRAHRRRDGVQAPRGHQARERQARDRGPWQLQRDRGEQRPRDAPRATSQRRRSLRFPVDALHRRRNDAGTHSARFGRSDAPRPRRRPDHAQDRRGRLRHEARAHVRPRARAGDREPVAPRSASRAKARRRTSASAARRSPSTATW